MEIEGELDLSKIISNTGVSLIDCTIAISVFKAAPDFNFLNKLSHLDLKKHNNQTNLFSIKIDEKHNRLSFRKTSNKSVSVSNIILNN